MEAQPLVTRPRQLTRAIILGVAIALTAAVYAVVDSRLHPKITIQCPSTIPISAVRGHDH